MFKFATLLVFALVLTVPASAGIMTWYADMSGAQEIPPAATSATGWGWVKFDDVDNVLSVWMTWSGLTGTSHMAHIHCCVASPPGNVGIALDLWMPTDPAGPASGNYSNSWDLDLVNPFRSAFTTANGGTALSAFAALRAAMDANEGRAYFNIHTSQFPGGEIRGNLAPVPEPATVFGVLAGLGLLVMRRRLVRS